jgi:uncharacterized membrane protein HdeD (DUF308 family)
VVAIVWPGPTAQVLVLVVAIWAFVLGFTEIFLAFGRGEQAGTRALFILTGLAAIAFGAVFASRPDIGAVTLALLFGLFSLVYGVTQVVVGIEIRHSGKSLESVLPSAEPLSQSAD